MPDNGSVPSPPMKDSDTYSDHLKLVLNSLTKQEFEGKSFRKMICFLNGLVTSEDFELVNLKKEGLYVIISLR
ncbi:hypothetical protein OROHE_022592 [Orobanche hederae]